MNELLKGVKTLGKGGSVTLQETGIWDALLNQDEITLYSTTLAAMRDRKQGRGSAKGHVCRLLYLLGQRHHPAGRYRHTSTV